MAATGITARIRGVAYGIVFTGMGVEGLMYLLLSTGLAPGPVRGPLLLLSPFTRSSVGSLPPTGSNLLFLVLLLVAALAMAAAGLYSLGTALFEDGFYLESGGPPT